METFLRASQLRIRACQIPTFEALLGCSKQFWVDLLKKYVLQNKAVCVSGGLLTLVSVRPTDSFVPGSLWAPRFGSVDERVPCFRAFSALCYHYAESKGKQNDPLRQQNSHQCRC